MKELDLEKESPNKEILQQLENCGSFLRRIGYSFVDVNDIALGEFHEELASYTEFHDDERDNQWVKVCRVCGEEISGGVKNDGKHDYHFDCFYDL